VPHVNKIFLCLRENGHLQIIITLLHILSSGWPMIVGRVEILRVINPTHTMPRALDGITVGQTTLRKDILIQEEMG